MKKGVKAHTKRGQLKLSFGMIFSIILIVIFLVFAFYAIKTFLGISDSAKTAKFVNNLQADIDRVWKSAQSSQEQEYFLPSKIEYVCFVDFFISEKGEKGHFYSELKRSYYGSENMVFYPFGSSELGSREIKNIDLIEITLDENPFCIQNTNGKAKLTLVKEFDDALVTITR